MDDPLVHTVSKEIGLDPGALLASWGVQRGTVVLSKSVTPSPISSNLQVRELSENAFTKLTSLERHKRFNFPAIWGYGIFEEAGEESVRKAALEAGRKQDQVHSLSSLIIKFRILKNRDLGIIDMKIEEEQPKDSKTNYSF